MLAFVDPETLIPADHPLRTVKRLADAALLDLSPYGDPPPADSVRKSPGSVPLAQAA
jgi:hypothetical protein